MRATWQIILGSQAMRLARLPSMRRSNAQRFPARHLFFSVAKYDLSFRLVVSSCLLIDGLINLDTFNNGSLRYRLFVILQRKGGDRDGFSRSFALFNRGCVEHKRAEFSRWRTDAFWDSKNERRRTTFPSHSKILWDDVWCLYSYRLSGIFFFLWRISFPTIVHEIAYE